MTIRWAALALAASSGFCGEWNPKLAADYLDARQKEWFAWPNANNGGTTCLSCHTGLTYALARPALRRALHEAGPISYETGLLDNVKARLAKWPPKEAKDRTAPGLGVDSVLATLLLAEDDARRGALSKETESALDRMWALQGVDEKVAGAWSWFNLKLDPWEMPESRYFGASLAALAVGSAPSGYQSRPAARENLLKLKTYLRDQQASQPLHNRLVLLWASTKLADTLSKAEQRALLDEVWRKQEPDGGWTLKSLGAWAEHADAPPSSGSNSYATALTAFIVQRAGVARGNPSLKKALGWLESHQNPETGFWEAQSMNKRYEPQSIPSGFMRDAATGFAVLALLEGTPEPAVQPTAQ